MIERYFKRPSIYRKEIDTGLGRLLAGNSINADLSARRKGRTSHLSEAPDSHVIQNHRWDMIILQRIRTLEGIKRFVYLRMMLVLFLLQIFFMDIAMRRDAIRFTVLIRRIYAVRETRSCVTACRMHRE